MESHAIYLITGPMAAGKTTVARLLAERFARGVHLEGDLFRRSILAGRAEMTPDPSPEALEQLRLRYRLAAAAADTYVRAGFTVVWDDVVAGPLLDEVISLVESRPLHVVVLLPTPATIASRGGTRYTSWTVDELHGAFTAETPRVGLWLDTSDQSPDETVDEILAQAVAPARAAVAGVDACPGGWAVAIWHANGEVELARVGAFREVLDRDVDVIAVDIPIGAPERPPREADLQARKFVGPRASSVFPTPPQIVLDAPDFPEALRRHRELTGKGMSKQAFYLCRRMLEVEQHALRDERIIEVHPEVSFRELAGGQVVHSKHSAPGLEKRRGLLARAGVDVTTPPRGLPLVDALDAAVAAWTAARWARGEAEPFPSDHTERLGAIWR